MSAPGSAPLTAAEGRRFAFPVGGAFLGLAFLLLWREKALLWPLSAVLGSMLILAGLSIPERLGPLRGYWMRGAAVISRFTTPVVLAILYFGVIAPIGMVGRLLGRNHVVRRPVDGSFWVPVAAEARRSDLKRQF